MMPANGGIIMSDAGAAPAVAPVAGPRTYDFEFRGRGGEYFGIWIVNLALTVVTLGIYSAWATVRTRRYFRGNTVLAGHAFDYHASPVRILIGRAIAVGLLLAYNLSIAVSPYAMIFWLPVALIVIPWLIVSSLRFNARNTSYRNVRFNFVGTYGGAAYAYYLWPLLSVLTIGLLIPLARRVHDYYYINNHTFGGRPFETRFSAARIYGIYILALAMWIGFFIAVAVVAVSAGVAVAPPKMDPGHPPPAALVLLLFPAIVAAELVVIAIGVWLMTQIFNLAVGNTTLDGRHRLRAELSGLHMTWILITNIVLTVLTIGLFYPWAQVRVARYRLSRMTLEAQSDLDEFTSEAFATQSAVGEEIAGFFDLDFGL